MTIPFVKLMLRNYGRECCESMCCCHYQCLSSFALGLGVVAEHTAPRANVLASHPNIVLLTADNDPSRSGAFPPHFPINAWKTQESIKTEKPNIAYTLRERPRTSSNIGRRCHEVILYCIFLQLEDEPVP